jgi:DNA polymerase III delta prime subunit
MPKLQDAWENEENENNQNQAKEDTTKPSVQSSFQLVARGSGDFKTIYRPQKFEELIPTCSIEQLRSFVDNPNSSRIFLFEGRTGTGKTTCARIVAKANVCLAKNTKDKPCLTCKNCENFDRAPDLLEINIADKRKIEDARQLVTEMSYRPQFLGKKIYILDEVQQLTPEAQQVLLKHLEEPKDYVWVFLCTTNKQGLDKALVDRANTVTFHDISPRDAGILIDQILEKIGKTATLEIKESFLVNAQGAVRALLKNLQAYNEGGYDPNQLLEEDEETAGVKELSTAITQNKWGNVAALLKKPDIRNNPEKTRIGLESYFRGALLRASDEPMKFGVLLKTMNGPLKEPVPYNDFVFRCYKAFEANRKYKMAKGSS